MQDFACPPPLHCVYLPSRVTHVGGNPQQTPGLTTPPHPAGEANPRLHKRLPSHFKLTPLHLVATAKLHSPLAAFTFALNDVAATVSL